jgi:hypothetical protein
MTFGINVQGGTGAGSKRTKNPDVLRCQCGGFLSKTRADQGATHCLRCESERRVQA